MHGCKIMKAGEMLEDEFEWICSFETLDLEESEEYRGLDPSSLTSSQSGRPAF